MCSYFFIVNFDQANYLKAQDVSECVQNVFFLLKYNAESFTSPKVSRKWIMKLYSESPYYVNLLLF